MYLYQEQEITLAHYNTTNHVFTFSLCSFIFRKLLYINNNGWKTEFYPSFEWVRVVISLVFCVMFCRSFLSFSFGYCIAYSSIFAFWLPFNIFIWIQITMTDIDPALPTDRTAYCTFTINAISKGKWQKRSTKHYTENQRYNNTNPLKTGVELSCSGRVSSSCSTSGLGAEDWVRWKNVLEAWNHLKLRIKYHHSIQLFPPQKYSFWHKIYAIIF
jgi:hypothetical protein